MTISAKISFAQYVKQEFVELLDALPITTVGRDYQARRVA